MFTALFVPIILIILGDAVFDAQSLTAALGPGVSEQ